MNSRPCERCGETDGTVKKSRAVPTDHPVGPCRCAMLCVRCRELGILQAPSRFPRVLDRFRR